MDIGMPLPGMAAVSGGRLAVVDDAGLRVWDLSTGEPVAVPPVDLPVSSNLNDGPSTSDVALSPDGTMLAALVGDLSVPSDLVVVDLATGADLFRTAVPLSIQGGEISYDGTTVAAGSFYDDYGPVHVYDVATGAERTMDAHGILP